MPHATEAEVQHLRNQIQDEREQSQHEDPILEKLGRLVELRDAGVLSEAEFEAQKARILASD